MYRQPNTLHACRLIDMELIFTEAFILKFNIHKTNDTDPLPPPKKKHYIT